MKKLIVGAALSAAAITNLASAKPFDPNDVFSPHPGFFTGSHYEALSSPERLRYLDGLMDGFLYAPMLAANGYSDHKSIEQLSQCNAAVGMTDIQFLKIVDDYMNTHPDYWGAPMNGSAAAALAQFCKKTRHPF
jgi:hypothetical protein